MLQTHQVKVVRMESMRVDLVVPCRECGLSFCVRMSRNDFTSIDNGEVPSRAATPSLSPDERNLIQHGVCLRCWDVMYVED